MDLFTPLVPQERWHPLFRMILQDAYAPERAVLTSWAEGFKDRDGKFVKEFQLTFESCFWELYLNASLAELGHSLDFTHHAPDFVVGGKTPFTLEATVAGPPVGGKPAYGYSQQDIPQDMNQFNRDSILRICNSFSSKVRRYQQHYATLNHVAGKPFVIGIASFDRPFAHLASLRPMLTALYGLYHDEEETPSDAESVVSYNMEQVPKNQNVNINVGLFCDNTYAEVSAVIYSSQATWGKVRGMADNPDAMSVYTTFHPQEGSLLPTVLTRLKREYSEHLLDGLLVLHNPFATHPLPKHALDHPRIARFHVDASGQLITQAPDDFLLMRMLQSVVVEND